MTEAAAAAAAAGSSGRGEEIHDDEIASLDRLMADLVAAGRASTQPNSDAAAGVREEEESLDALVSKYLALPPEDNSYHYSTPDNSYHPVAYAAGRQHQLHGRHARGQEEEEQQGGASGHHKQGGGGASPGYYWVGCTTPYFAEEAVAGLGDPLGAVVAGSHVRVVDVYEQRWVVEVPPPHGASYARLRVACLAADVHACAWRRLS